MSGWDETVTEIAAHPEGLDGVRREKLKQYADHVGRNVICYYSAWLQKPSPGAAHFLEINDDDKHGFMSVLHGSDTARGLDLFLHSPGGDLAATESVIHYLRSKFGSDIRTIVPQISMSGGTLLAFSGKTIIMGRPSNLGPIDPQLGDMSAVDIIADWETAKADIAANPAHAGLYAPMLGRYPLGFINHVRAINHWGKDIGINALRSGMLKDEVDGEAKAKSIVDVFSSKKTHHSHARHLHREDCEKTGLNITHLEADQALQELVLSVHHAYIATLHMTNAAKIISNDAGRGKIIFL